MEELRARTREEAWRGWRRMPSLRGRGHTAGAVFTVVGVLCALACWWFEELVDRSECMMRVECVFEMMPSHFRHPSAHRH